MLYGQFFNVKNYLNLSKNDFDLGILQDIYVFDKHIFLSFSEILPQRFGMHANDFHLFPTVLEKNRRPEEGKEALEYHNLS